MQGARARACELPHNAEELIIQQPVRAAVTRQLVENMLYASTAVQSRKTQWAIIVLPGKRKEERCGARAQR